jgi:hypothetical protein
VAAGANFLVEPRAKRAGDFFRGRFDQPAAELGDLATDIGLRRIFQEGRIRAVGGQRHVRAALGEAGDAALAFALDRIAVRRIEVLQRYFAVEGRLDRPDL